MAKSFPDGFGPHNGPRRILPSWVVVCLTVAGEARNISGPFRDAKTADAWRDDYANPHCDYAHEVRMLNEPREPMD